MYWYSDFPESRPGITGPLESGDDLLSKGEAECSLGLGSLILRLAARGEGGPAVAEVVGSESVRLQLRVGAWQRALAAQANSLLGEILLI